VGTSDFIQAGKHINNSGANDSGACTMYGFA